MHTATAMLPALTELHSDRLAPRNSTGTLPLNLVATSKLAVILYNMREAGVPQSRLDEIQRLWVSIGDRGPQDPVRCLQTEIIGLVLLSFTTEDAAPPPPVHHEPTHLDFDLSEDEEDTSIVHCVCDWLRAISLVSSEWKSALESSLISAMLLQLLRMHGLSGDISTSGEATAYRHFISECWRKQALKLMFVNVANAKINHRLMRIRANLIAMAYGNYDFEGELPHEIHRAYRDLDRMDENLHTAYDLLTRHMARLPETSTIEWAERRTALASTEDKGRGFANWPPMPSWGWFLQPDSQNDLFVGELVRSGEHYEHLTIFVRLVDEQLENAREIERTARALVSDYYTKFRPMRVPEPTPLP